ncbi:hypothetical protein GGF46_002328 [Coemansia sp. RSA 552]|nr:hypothetical protein GGF46_002328 [Coemansia sp. RSA 552]
MNIGLLNSQDDPLEVVDYDPQWPVQFAAEQERIQQALGKYALGVEHVGSTSIPGLAAKPIVDIQIVVSSFQHLAQCIQEMQAIGYTYLGQNGVEGREYFARPRFHCHMVELDNDEYTRKRLFLGYLRDHPHAREEYAELKRRLARKWANRPNGRHSYNADKTPFIMDILAKAGWNPEREPALIQNNVN